MGYADHRDILSRAFLIQALNRLRFSPYRSGTRLAPILRPSAGSATKEVGLSEPSSMTSPTGPARDIEMTTLSNGVRVITETMPHVRSVSVGVWIATGSRRETPRQTGISHFIEHMLFKGTT